jgi:hypothetical protein
VEEFHAMKVKVSLAARAYPNDNYLGFDNFRLCENDEAQPPSQMECAWQLQAGPPFSQVLGPPSSCWASLFLAQLQIRHGKSKGISTKSLPHIHSPDATSVPAPYSVPKYP